MSSINRKNELKLKWGNHCGNGNDDASSNNIFTIKDTKLYVPGVLLTKSIKTYWQKIYFRMTR